MIDALWQSLYLVLALIGLLGFSAFFSSSETAVFSLKANAIGDIRTRKPRTARLLTRLLEHRQKLLVTVLLGNLIVNLLFFNLGNTLIARLAAEAPAAGWIGPVCLLCAVIILGEIIPKLCAVRWPVAIASATAWPLHALEVLLAIPRAVLAAIAAGIGRILLGNQPGEGQVSTAELGALLDIAHREGALPQDEHVRLLSVLELDRMRVRDVRTPRLEIVALRRDATRDEALQLHRESGCSKIILHDGDIDRASHWVDVLELLGDEAMTPQSLARALLFVPESARITDVLVRFRELDAHIALVVDEYGGTEGVVTRHDLIGAILGELEDEQDDRETEVVADGASGWMVRAGLSVRALGRLAGEPLVELGVETVGGLVTARLGRLPKVGDRVHSGALEFEVVEVTRRRASRIRVAALQEARP